MLAALLLAGIVASPLSSVALFFPARRPRRAGGAWPALKRLVSALAGTALAAGAAGAALLLAGTSRAVTIAALAVLGAASLAWLPVTRRWNGRSHLAWSASVFLFASYLAFILWWTFASRLGPVSTAGGLLLWLFEAAAAVLACAYLWELCDALGSQHWRRRIGTTSGLPDGCQPFASLHVPAHKPWLRCRRRRRRRHGRGVPQPLTGKPSAAAPPG